MIFNIIKLAMELKINSPDLITRVHGRLVFQKTKKLLGNITSDETVIFDFAGIKVIDSSFIDEFIVNHLWDAMNNKPGYYIKLRNISKSSEINIESLLSTYSNYNNQKLVILTEDICQTNNFFIGPLSDIESDMINYLRLNKTGSLSDITEFTGLIDKRAGELLNQLVHLRLIKKSGGGYFSSV